MSAGLHLQKLLYEPEGLTCLPEISGSLGRNLAAVGRDYKKLSLTLGICTFLSHLKGKLRISVGIVYYSLAAHDHSFQETGALCVISITHIAVIQLSLCFRHNAFVADLKNFPVFYGNMSYTIIEIVSRCKNIVVNCANCFRCHISSGKLTGGLAFPVLMHLAKICLGLLGNIERIRDSGLYGIQLIFQPLE